VTSWERSRLYSSPPKVVGEIPNTNLCRACRLLCPICRCSGGYSLLNIRHCDPSSHSISGFFAAFILQGNPRRNPVSKAKNYSVWQTWIVFHIRTSSLASTMVCLSFLSSSYPGKHTTATVTCCLQPSGWVMQPFISYHLLWEIRKFFDYFIDPLRKPISQRPIEYNYSVDSMPLS